MHSFSAALRRGAALGAALAGAGLAASGLSGCHNDVNVTSPNAPTSATFWQSSTDAQAGVTATYNALLRLGTFQRWQGFSYDMRSDIGTSSSPWAELQAFVKHQYPSGLDFDIVRDTWNDSYTLISRANLAVTNIPSIQMDTTQRATLVGEAKFLRGITYFHLMALYGGNIPLITAPVTAADRPASSDSASVYAQIEKDFADAAAVLPKQTMVDAKGRAVAGAAQGMLGKTLLQERKWAAAAAALAPVVNKQYGNFSLLPNYGDLFRGVQGTGNNGPEALFEVEFGNLDLAGQGLGGFNVSKMIGPCGPSYCDGRPTRWYFSQFLLDSTTAGTVDPRLDATLFYYKGDTTTVYAETWKQRYGADTTSVYFKKYGEYYSGSTDQTWEAQINYKVLRYADVLLMYAEALNEQGQAAAAAPYVNQVRARVGLRPIAASLSQADMRAAILKERLLEFGLEGQRWLDLGRQGLLTASYLPTLIAHDPDFNTFVVGRSQLLPIPQRERDLNPNVRQNPGF